MAASGNPILDQLLAAQQQPAEQQYTAPESGVKKFLKNYLFAFSQGLQGRTQNEAMGLALQAPQLQEQQRMAQGQQQFQNKALLAQLVQRVQEDRSQAAAREAQANALKPVELSPKMKEFLGIGEDAPPLTRADIADLYKERIKGAARKDTTTSNAELALAAAQGDPIAQSALDKLGVGVDKSVSEVELAVSAVRGDKNAQMALDKLNKARATRIQMQINAVDDRMQKRYGLQLDMASRKLNAQFGPAEAALGEIEKQYEKVLGAADIASRTKEWQVLNGLVKSKASLIARANGEKGNLAEGDVIRSLEGLASPGWVAAGDPAGIQRAKLLATKNSLLTSKQKALAAFSQESGDGFSGGGKIRVRRKSDGQTGTLNEADFDPDKYERQ